MSVPKSVEGRHRRRRRYIDAIDPLRQRYSCTAAQVYSNVMSELNAADSRASQMETALNKANEETDQVKMELLKLRASIK